MATHGEIEELLLTFNSDSLIVGLAPALRRVKVIRLYDRVSLTPQQFGELSGGAAENNTGAEKVIRSHRQ
jgi:hypothetical protein